MQSGPSSGSRPAGRPRAVLLAGLSLAALAGLIAWEVDRRQGINRLHGPLSRVEIRFDCWGFTPHLTTSPWRGKWVGTDDSAFLTRVEEWLAGLEHYQVPEAFRQGGHKILLTFQDGRQEQLFCHSLDHPGDMTGECGPITWEGFRVRGGEEPFTDFFIRNLRADGGTGGPDGR